MSSDPRLETVGSPGAAKRLTKMLSVRPRSGSVKSLSPVMNAEEVGTILIPPFLVKYLLLVDLPQVWTIS